MTNISQFSTFLCNFCHFLDKHRGLDVENVQQGTNSLSKTPFVIQIEHSEHSNTTIGDSN